MTTAARTPSTFGAVAVTSLLPCVAPRAGTALSSATKLHYYVVEGVRRYGAWQYGWSWTVSPGLFSPSWDALSFPVAINDSNHTELLGIGLTPQPTNRAK